MSNLISTTREQIINHLLQGDRRLKRVALQIRSKLNPNALLEGYALVNELNENLFAFFCTSKFAVDEELVVTLNLSGNVISYNVKMSHFHEQISSGRVMKSLPTEETPFTGQKFYRCFGKVIQPQAATGSPSLSVVPDAPAAAPTDPLAELAALAGPAPTETAPAAEAPPADAPSEPAAA